MQTNTVGDVKETDNAHKQCRRYKKRRRKKWVTCTNSVGHKKGKRIMYSNNLGDKKERKTIVYFKRTGSESKQFVFSDLGPKLFQVILTQNCFQ